jgi:predicted heme/steroid binding protein
MRASTSISFYLMMMRRQPLLLLLLCTRIISSSTFITVPKSKTHNHRRKSAINVEPSIIAGGIIVIATGATTAWWIGGANERENKSKYAEYEALQQERERLAFIQPKDQWLEEELNAYNGENDPSGPILLAVKGDVFNVWKGRNFYGPDGEYHIMAGRDATRFLAKNRLDLETEQERQVELNIAERANLEVWYWTIKNKYQFVGNLAGYDPKSTEM